MLNLSYNARPDDIATIQAAHLLRITICTDSIKSTPPTATTDIYIYKGTTALSSSTPIPLPTGGAEGHKIIIKSLNGSGYVSSAKGIINLSSTTATTAAISISTYARAFIYTSLGWICTYA